MNLSDIIRHGPVATATVATVATLRPATGPSVATVATVNVANPNGTVSSTLPGVDKSASPWVTWATGFAERGAAAYAQWLATAETGEGAP